MIGAAISDVPPCPAFMCVRAFVLCARTRVVFWGWGYLSKALLEYCISSYPDLDFAFVIGTDLVETLESWTSDAVPEWGFQGMAQKQCAHALWNATNFIVINRPGYDIPEKLQSRMGKNFQLLVPLVGTTLVTQQLSSSEVRARLRRSTSSHSEQSASTSVRSNSIGESERARIADGDFELVDGLVPPAVLAHIIRYGLYV